ncbi:MAG: protein kinase [Polyangia bacterium]
MNQLTDLRSADGPGPESYETLYEEDACGRLSVLPRGEIVRINRTLLGWIGYSKEEALGRRFSSLLTVASALLYETHCAPLLGLRGFLSEIALELKTRDGAPLSVLLSAVARRDASGAPSLIRISVMSAPTRRQYERELLRAREEAEDAAEQLRALRDLAERKVAEQDVLLSSVRRMASGDLMTPVPVDEGSGLAVLAGALERMRHDVLRTIRQMDERNAEVLQLNRELRRQIEQRSRLLIESIEVIGAGKMDGTLAEQGSGEVELQPILALGTHLAGRYRIEGILGQGGMGTVYEVLRLEDGRRYAAKVLGVKPNYQAVHRFAREAQLLARLHHPNLIGIIDIDITEDRVAFIVMELVRGKSLADLSARYGETDFMLQVLLQVAEALAAVHRAGVVHRDLKPANVLIALDTERGGAPAVKLADFGVSRLQEPALETPNSQAQAASEVASLATQLRGLPLDAGATQRFPSPGHAVAALAQTEAPGLTPPPPVVTPEPEPGVPQPSPRPGGSWPRRPAASPGGALTEAGTLLGTPLYMAPELSVGAQRARPASDMFSFGILAYEVLTGTLPFAQTPLLWGEYGGGTGAFVPLAKRCPGLAAVDRGLLSLLDSCLHRDPAHRPTADALAEALLRALVCGGAEPAVQLSS